MNHPRRLLSVAHSYCLALNRRLAHEMARLGAGEWEVTAVAPAFFQGDLRPVALETFKGEQCRLEPVSAYFTKHIHVMLYGRRLHQILREPWDVVHCWEEPYILAGGQIAWWTPSRRALVYATFQNISKQYPPPFNWIERYAMRRARGCIAFGHTAYQTLARQPHYLDRARRVIPVGVDVERFYPDSKAGEQIRRQLGWAASEPPVVGYLGRFVPEKGLGLLMSVLDGLSLPWRGLFVGSGPMEKDLREWETHQGDRVRVVTGIQHNDVPAYLNAMDVLCAPSQTMPNWREQLGRMLIEAFACGVPVIASDSGEMPYVVKDAGIIVGEKDENGWARTLAELLENPARRAELSARGIERARSVYAWPVVARQHLDFFSEILTTPENPR